MGRRAMVSFIRRVRRQRVWTTREVPLDPEHVAHLPDTADERVVTNDIYTQLRRHFVKREWCRIYAMLCRGCSQKEIAQAVGITPSGVSQIVSRLKEIASCQS